MTSQRSASTQTLPTTEVFPISTKDTSSRWKIVAHGTAKSRQYPRHAKRTEQMQTFKRMHNNLSPFEKIKAKTGKTTAHGHPLILPTEYGQFGPAFDVIALYHNAIKRQVLVAYNVLDAFQRFRYEVSTAETELLYNWLEAFQDTVLTLLNTCEREIFQTLETKSIVFPAHLDLAARDQATAVVRKASEAVASCKEVLRLMPAGESVPRLSILVREFLGTLIDLLETHRVALPRVFISAKIGLKEERQLHSRFIQTLSEDDNGSFYVPFVSHWLSLPQLTK